MQRAHNFSSFGVARCLTLIVVIAALTSGCSVKRKVKVDVSPNIGQDKTASFDELLDIVGRYEKIDSLTCNSVHLTLTTGKKARGYLEEYPRTPGYILLHRPDSLLLVLRKTLIGPVFQLLSKGDDFFTRIPSENKFYIGKNSAGELVPEDSPDGPGFTLRPKQIFDAILPQGIDIKSPGVRVSCYEAADAEMRYYVLSLYKDEGAPRIHVVRKIWIERTGLTIARQQMYAEGGEVISDIRYTNEKRPDGFSLPLEINVDRPLDGYSLKLEFSGWRINPDLDWKSAFVLEPRPGDKVIHLMEKKGALLFRWKMLRPPIFAPVRPAQS